LSTETPRTLVLHELEQELHRSQAIIDDLLSSWRGKINMTDLAGVLGPHMAHNREILRLMTILVIDPKETETRLTKVLSGD
jgi:hypothetical protein